MKLGELYGETDPLTYDWTDGLIAMAVRKFSKELSKHSSDDTRPSTSGSVMTDHTRVCINISEFQRKLVICKYAANTNYKGTDQTAYLCLS